MAPLLWRNVFLSLHIFSFVVLSGGVVGGILMHRLLWQAVDSAPQQLPLALRFNRALGLCGPIGGGLLLLTGLGLLASTHWAFWGQPWLTGKLVLWLVLALMGNLEAKPLGAKLGARLGALVPTSGGGAIALAANPELLALRQRLARFHLIHGVLFATVVLLAVFKP